MTLRCMYVRASYTARVIHLRLRRQSFWCAAAGASRLFNIEANLVRHSQAPHIIVRRASYKILFYFIFILIKFNKIKFKTYLHRLIRFNA